MKYPQTMADLTDHDTNQMEFWEKLPFIWTTPEVEAHPLNI